jgi:hypothetical protein
MRHIEQFNEYRRQVEQRKIPWRKVGKLYESYVGWKLESDGWDLTYRGIMEARHDRGIDLIGAKNEKRAIIQCKMWSREGRIQDWQILKFYRDWDAYCCKINDWNWMAVFVTHSTLDDNANHMAKHLGVTVWNFGYQPQKWPLVKCNIEDRTKEKRYYLPTDGGYHTLKITISNGERFAFDCEEAERYEFQWIGLKRKQKMPTNKRK